MINNQRQIRILSLLKQERFMTISELSRIIHYSPSTVRRDLSKLEEDNMVKRTHGGALAIKPNEIEMPTKVKENIHFKEKKYISGLTTGYIEGQQTIFLDGSSTALVFAHSLTDFNNLTIVTTNLETAIYLSLNSQNKVYIPGGLLTDVRVNNSMTCESLKNFVFDIAIFSCRGISTKFGITERLENEATMKHVVAKKTKKIILLADDNKFGQNLPFNCCPISSIFSVVTNKKPKQKFLKYFKDNKVEIVY